MDLGVFEDKFEESIAKKEFITFFCKCKIVYSGRAEAELGKGDRLVSVKQDGTIFVHQPEGGNPINYMKAGGRVELIKKDYGVLFKAHNSTTKEYLELEISRVYNFMSKKLEDGTTRTRPLCPYPQVRRYVGEGSTDDAANFECVKP